MNEKRNRIVKLVVSILLPQAAGAIGALCTASSIPSWYADLEKPWFNPPNWIFGPVWTILYIMMGAALYLVWRNGLADRKRKTAVALFAVQLALNLLWSILFFGMRSPLAGLVEIAFLWVFILAALMAFYRVSKSAGLLLAPYLLWVSFAAVLNYMIYIMNN
jgi:translocator protein